MALFENMFGTRPAGRGESPKEFKPKPFRKPGRLERNDPAAMRAYEEEKKAYEEDMQASIADTERLFGKEWRKRASEKSKAEKPQKAQEALAERAAINRSLRPPDGAVTKTQTPQTGVSNLAKRFEASRKRYEEELSARGFTPPQTREEESRFNAERMADFRYQLAEKENARRAETYITKEYSDLKRAANEARANKQYGAAVAFERQANDINEAVGGNITNSEARRRFFDNQANQAIREELQRRAEERRVVTQKQTSANPEAGDFRPKATGAPIGVGTEVLTYAQKPKVGGAMEQSFGMVPPSSQDQGVDFKAISAANVGDEAIATEEVTAPSRQAAPSEFKPPTSKSLKEEDILPGISQMPPVVRESSETPKQYNDRVLQEYENNVILPSFSEEVQGAFLNAKELNAQEKDLFAKRFASPENKRKHKEIEKQAKEQHKILKSEIDALRKNSRNLAEFPLGSQQRKLNDQKIATLRKQLGFFARRLY